MTIKDLIQNELDKKYGKDWYIYILSVGNRRAIGKHYHYHYEYAMNPRKGWLGGYCDGTFIVLKTHKHYVNQSRNHR